MLRFSTGFLALVIFLGLISFSSFWPLSFVRFGQAPDGFVLGSAVSRNAEVSIENLKSFDKVTVSLLAFRGQRTVYHQVAFVRNSASKARKFTITKPRVISPTPSMVSSEAYFLKDGQALKEVSIGPQEEEALSVGVVLQDGGTPSLTVTVEFTVVPF